MQSQKVIYGFILSIVHNCSDADDIMQETMALMWERFEEFRAGTNFGAWGIRIARYKTLNFLKKNKRHAYEKFDETLINKIDDCYSHKKDEFRYRLFALQECIKKLDKSDRKLIQIHYEDGLKINEMALHLNRPLPGLYKVMARIHTTLRKCVNHTILKWDL